jgi:mono/diheme cytochrome c family protein
MRAGTALVGAVIGLAIAFALFAVLFTWGGLTHHKSLPLEKQLGNLSVGLSARLHAGTARNPVPETASSLNIGQTAYRTCVQCHGAAGDGRADLGLAVYPPAANLLEENAKNLTDAQLFWIIKNGLSFTAMPAYANQYRDDAIWSIVNYIRVLQQGRAIAFGPPLTSEPASERAARRVSFQFTDSSLQPATATAQAGTVGLSLANRGAQGHSVVISSNGKVPYNAGRLLPTETSQVEGNLDPGDYLIAVDPSAASPGPTAMLSVR